MPHSRRPTIEYTIATQTHGRYLLSPGDSSDAPLLIGFHGYGETAEEDLNRLLAIPRIDGWTVVSIQGLHQFYRRRTDEVVASWMTRQNRELLIADNISYIASVVGRLSEEWKRRIVLAGFSQGVAMAFRAAANLHTPVAGVIACGGEVPPELETKALSRIPAALLGRGLRDEWYTSEKLTADEDRLRAAGVGVESFVLDAGHEWTAEFSEICARFLTSHD